MGARQSMQGSEVARRPRANSSIETGVEVQSNGSRNAATVSGNHNGRPASQYHDTSSETEEDGEDAGRLLAGLMNFGLGGGSPFNASSSSTTTNSSSPGAANERSSGHRQVLTPSASSAPSTSMSNQLVHTRNNNSRHGATNGSLRFAFRPPAMLSRSNTRNGSRMTVAGSSSANTRIRHSMPLLQFIGRDLKCPICHKTVPSDDVEVHLVMCFTKPVIAYNEETLQQKKGECAICLDEMDEGDTIARLPCLCIYHKDCIDAWFKRKNSCPEHPGD